MDIKIPSGPKEGSPIDSAKEAMDAVESTSEADRAQQTSAVDNETVEQIAAEVAAGRIGRNEAIDRLLDEVLGSRMVGSAPEELRAELGELLKSLLETDPYLKSLGAAMGLDEPE